MHFLHGGHAIYRGPCLLINHSAQIMCIVESDMIVFILPVGPGRAFIVSAFFLKTFKMENSNGTVLPMHSDRCKITGATKLNVRTAALARDANPTIQIKIACAMPALD